MIKPRETFHFNPTIQINGDWMIGSTDLEVQSSIFNITEENINFENGRFADEKSGGVSYKEVRDEIEKNLDISDITASDLEDDIIAPIITEEYREQVAKRTKDDGYMRILAIYVSSLCQDFESFL